ncbi:hypothetical protein LGAA44_10041 [Leuconostoc gasicomitatum]|nr:hypothetical protein LGAA44_10041 [Leuconostoc gasicomitatum]
MRLIISKTLYIVHNITILYLILLYLMYNIIIKLIFTGEKTL